MRLEEELKCFSLLGFGSGHVWGKANIRPDEKLDGTQGYCAKFCPDAARCTGAHLKRVQLMFPKAAKAFDKMATFLGQQKATEMWRAQNPVTPLEPYALAMVMNVEDGLAVAQTGAPKDRGPQTLAWPRSAS